MICYHTGMRIGECFGLDLKHDIDFDRHTISINRQMQQNLNGEWIYKNPKYDSIRTLKIGSTLESLLKSEISVVEMNRIRYGEYYTRLMWIWSIICTGCKRIRKYLMDILKYGPSQKRTEKC